MKEGREEGNRRKRGREEGNVGRKERKKKGARKSK
jgi:hypothetical protein